MLAGFSPGAQRAIALLLLVLMVVGAWSVLVVPLAAAITQQIEQLQALRDRVAKLEAATVEPAPRLGPPVPSDLILRVAKLEQAQAYAAQQLDQVAASEYVQITAKQPVPADTAVARLQFTAQGRETDLLNFVARLEQSRPPIRLPSWHFRQIPGNASLQLEADAAVVWSSR